MRSGSAATAKALEGGGGFDRFVLFPVNQAEAELRSRDQLGGEGPFIVGDFAIIFRRLGGTAGGARQLGGPIGEAVLGGAVDFAAVELVDDDGGLVRFADADEDPDFLQ